MQTVLVPYLNFNGNAGEAMKFYQNIFGGELKLQTFGDAGMANSEDEKDRLIHGELKTDTFSFMASDGHKDHQVEFGTSVHMSLVGSDEAALTEYFNKLSEGGTVDMPLAKQFWGDTFGMVTDKYGIHWMVNISGASS
jgi:PhnB protein